MSDAAPRLYTRRELVAEARSLGFAASERQHTDWVSLGLLDKAERRGQWRADRQEVGWSENQRQLWLTLLRQHARVRRVGPLCNLPVWLWLFYGDRVMPLRQVRLAMDTWKGSQLFGSSAAQRKNATETVAAIADGRAKARQKKELAHWLVGAEVARLDDAARGELDDLTEIVMAPWGRKPRVHRPPSPKSLSGLVTWRLTAARGFSGIPDALWPWARAFYLYTFADYVGVRPLLAVETGRPGLFSEPALNDLVNEACLNLLTILGMGLAGFDTSTLPPGLHPTTWLTGEAAPEEGGAGRATGD